MDYSVVIPVYNSQDSLYELRERLAEIFSTLKASFELIFVNDYSLDNSWMELVKLKEQYNEQVKIVSLSKNFGQSGATFCGLQFAEGVNVITIDDDLQFFPEDIPLLIKEQENSNADVVYGLGSKGHSITRQMASFLYKIGVDLLEAENRISSSFRLIKADVVKKISQQTQQHVPLEVLLNWHTNNFSSVKVRHIKRPVGKTGYNMRQAKSMLLRSAFNHGRWPLKLMVYFGTLTSFITFAIGAYFLARRLFYGSDFPGFTALIVTIMFSTSILLICFGIIGSYIITMHSEINRKPPFSIKEKQL